MLARTGLVAAACALTLAGCGAGADAAAPSTGKTTSARGTVEGRDTQRITIPGTGHEVNLYRAATDGEALWLTDELVPVLYRYDLETGAVTEQRLNGMAFWTPTGEPSDIGVAVGGDVVWVSDPCKQCPAGDVYKVAGDSVERWKTTLPEPFWMTWSNGRLWVSSFARNEVVALHPDTGKVTDRVPVNGPSGTVNAFGRMWMVGSHGNNVIAHDPATGSNQTVSLGEQMTLNPEHVVEAAGSIWVNNPAGALIRIDPDTLETKRYEVPEPVEIASGDDVVWVGSKQGVYRLHPADGKLDHWELPEISGLVVTDSAVFAVEMSTDAVHRIQP